MDSVPKNAERPVITIKDNSCSIQNEDKKWVFVSPAIASNINKNSKLIKEFMSHFEIYNDITLLSEGKDGIYTWVIYGEENKPDLKFACIQVLSPFEIGTSHHSLVHNSRVNAERIYGAGELKKTGDKITYNLNSGTYTFKIVMINLSSNNAKSKVIKSAFERFFPNAVFSDTDGSMIYTLNVMPNKILDLYSKYGYDSYLFDIRNECIKFNYKYNNMLSSIKYYFKKFEEAGTLNDKEIYNQHLIENLKSMLELIKNKKNTDSSGTVVGGKRGRKTRRRNGISRRR
jgi:hypothetical protein